MRQTAQRHHLKIAWVESIQTITKGGEIYKSANEALLPFEAKLSKVYDITFLKYQALNKNMSYTQIFPHVLRFSVRNASYLLSHRYGLLITVDMPNMEGLVPFMLGLLMRKPILLKETHWYWPHSLGAKLSWSINLWLVRKAAVVIVPSQRVKQYWKGLGIDIEKIAVVPFYASVLRTDRHTTDLAVTLRNRFKDKIIITYIGRLLEKKGVEYLIEAFAKVKRELPESVLVIVGEGPDRNKLEKTSKLLGIEGIAFLGAVSEKDKPAYFMMADICVCPSITLGTPEEWGMVVTEAMSVGKPVVVTTATGSALDVVQSGVNGYIVPERNPTSLYEAIKALANDPNLRKRMGEESKRIADRFSFSYAADLMTQTIDSVGMCRKTCRK